MPSDPGGVDNAKKGLLLLPFGKLFEKGLRVGTGQCNVKKYNRHLRDMIISGRAKPSVVVSHPSEPLNNAPTAYEKFDKRIEGYTKVHSGRLNGRIDRLHLYLLCPNPKGL